jgi:hypothetical protein
VNELTREEACTIINKSIFYSSSYLVPQWMAFWEEIIMHDTMVSQQDTAIKAEIGVEYKTCECC